MNIKSSEDIWEEFKEQLSSTVYSIKADDFRKAWLSSGNRTTFYMETLLPEISKQLQLDLKREAVFRFDAVMFKKAKNKHEIPIIIIESENNAESAVREVYKLCAVNAPLKVLFLCLEWSDEIRKSYTEDYYDNIVNAFNETTQLVGYLGIIVTEMTEKLRFHTCCFNDNGTLVDIKNNFIEKEME